MSTKAISYEVPLRFLASELATANRKRLRSSVPQIPTVTTKPQIPNTPKPLGRLEEYLVQLKHCTSLLREWLVEVKDASFVLALIWGLIDLLIKLHR